MKLSIIIPVYNAEQYIEECIASLLCQSITEFEIIVVDDKGGDSSMQKVEAIKSTHNLGNIITILTMPQNSGAYAARNAGIEVAKGEYIGFVDADDWCDSDMFRSLYENAVKNNADWSYCGAVEEYRLGFSKLISQMRLKSGVLNDDERKKFAKDSKALFWTGIYRREFLSKHNLKFPKSKFSEDSYFVCMVAFAAERVAVVDNHYYHYRIVETSVSRRPDPTKAMQKVSIFNKLLADLKEKGAYNNSVAEIDYLCLKKGYIIPLLIECINHPNDCSERVDKIKRELYLNIPLYYKNPYLKSNKKYKLMLKMMLKYPRIMSILLRLKFKQDPF